jgi:hypothetical protein
VNFPYNLNTSCTSIEQVNLPYSHIGKTYYINNGIVTFLTLIWCDSYWIMGEGRMEYIYWLLVNIPDNFLTTCTSIEQVNLPYSHIGKTYYINTGIVTFITHILCDSYWIMGDRRMEYINWLLVNFPDNFLTTCTSFEQVNLPFSHIGKMYYINSRIDFLWTFHTVWSPVALRLSSWTFLPVRLEKYYINTRIVRFLVHDSLVPGNPSNIWISIGLNDKHMDTFESQSSIIG